MITRFGAAELDKHFRFFDTICGATQDRQDALEKLLHEPMDLLLVIGGYNSSNTSHLAEMGEARLATFFVKNAAMMVSDTIIRHYSLEQQKEVETVDWLPPGKITVGITAGASCPNNLIEDAIKRLFELRAFPCRNCWPTESFPCRVPRKNWRRGSGRYSPPTRNGAPKPAGAFMPNRHGLAH